MNATFAAPAKLNLFLHVIGRRADGYHLLESVFQLVDFGDVITVAVRPDGQILRLNQVVGVPAESDLAVRAARLLQQTCGITAGADLTLEKRIPLGAGLGGGSSDAATVMLALNRLWNLDLPRSRLMELGLALGADVPFFLFGRNAFASGVGERLAVAALPALWFVVLKPQVSIPTHEIFGQPDLTRNAKSVKMLDFSAAARFGAEKLVGCSDASGAGGDGAGAIFFPEPVFRNDLQPVAARMYPEVGKTLAWLAHAGQDALIGARMTGSGSCVFAGFGNRNAAESVFAQRPPDIGGFVASGLECHPLIDFAH